MTKKQIDPDFAKEISKELEKYRAQLVRLKKLKILKTRLAKGEITLQQFNKLKVDKPKKKITKTKKKITKTKKKQSKSKNIPRDADGRYRPKARGITTDVKGRSLEPDFLFDYSDDYCEKCGSYTGMSNLDFCTKCGISFN